MANYENTTKWMTIQMSEQGEQRVRTASDARL